MAGCLSGSRYALQESGIPVPHHICINRDGLPEGQDPEGFIETEDYVEMDGEQSSPILCFMNKAFPSWLPVQCLPSAASRSTIAGSVRHIFSTHGRCLHMHDLTTQV